MKDWLAKLEPKWVATNIIGWGFLAVVLYWNASQSAKWQDAHLRLVDKTIENGGKIVDTQRAIADTQSVQTPIINRIDRNTSK